MFRNTSLRFVFHSCSHKEKKVKDSVIVVSFELMIHCVNCIHIQHINKDALFKELTVRGGLRHFFSINVVEMFVLDKLILAPQL